MQLFNLFGIEINASDASNAMSMKQTPVYQDEMKFVCTQMSIRRAVTISSGKKPAKSRKEEKKE